MVRTDEVRLQVQVVVQPDLAVVDLASNQRREFRMSAVEAGDCRRKMRLSILSLQMRMALRTTSHASGRQAHVTSMLPVAGGAMRRETLIGTVYRAVVTGETRLVAYFLEERSGPSQMAEAALLRKDSVSLGEGAA
jgi:hypothetical protein